MDPIQEVRAVAAALIDHGHALSGDSIAQHSARLTAACDAWQEQRETAELFEEQSASICARLVKEKEMLSEENASLKARVAELCDALESWKRRAQS